MELLIFIAMLTCHCLVSRTKWIQSARLRKVSKAVPPRRSDAKRRGSVAPTNF
jgi:hypothetical protein